MQEQAVIIPILPPVELEFVNLVASIIVTPNQTEHEKGN